MIYRVYCVYSHTIIFTSAPLFPRETKMNGVPNMAANLNFKKKLKEIDCDQIAIFFYRFSY